MTPAAEQRWYAVYVTATPAAADTVEFVLDMFGCLGTEIDHLRKQEGANIRVAGYFEALPDRSELESALFGALQDQEMDRSAIRLIETGSIEDRDWLAEWKKHWKPTEVGPFVIAPTWETVEQPDKIVIRIEPNMAFGTGTHETTQLCLKAVGELYKPGMSFLDVGTGTGILAIAAAELKLAAEKPDPGEEEEGPFDGESPGVEVSVPSVAGLLAFDTDADSVKIARENAQLNGVGRFIEFVEGPLDVAIDRFDFVAANLTLDVIEPLLPVLLGKTRQTLVMSGILAEQETPIRNALERLDVRDFAVEQMGEWISVTVRQGE